jgi:DNA-binding transcriptional LysR family regulator
MLNIQAVNIASVDLNLLVVFDAVFKDRNITVAAQRVGLSQPAMSSALNRLRKTFDDPLFVRTGNGMQPTPYAQLLAPPIQRACELIVASLQIGGSFDPARSTRTFTFYMTDIGHAVFLPKLVAAMARHAPEVKLQVLRIPERGAHDAMAAGEVDIAIGLFPDLKAGFFQQRLYRDSFVCVIGANHPHADGELSPKEFANLSHAVVSSAGTGHEAAVERAFIDARLQRRVRLTIPHFMAIPVIVAQTDVVVTVPKRLALAFAGFPNIKLFEPPIKISTFEIKQHWHQRFHQDETSKWLRRIIADLFLET